jgi:hypothetical protein
MRVQPRLLLFPALILAYSTNSWADDASKSRFERAYEAAKSDTAAKKAFSPPGRTAAPDDSALETFTRAPDRRPKVIIGDDDREDYFTLLQLGGPKLAAARATALITSRNRLANQRGKFILFTSPFQMEFDQVSFPPCPNERFATQRLGGYCTAFLVKPDVVLTAGHCVPDASEGQPDDSAAIVFGYRVEAPPVIETEYDTDRVYFVKSVVRKNRSNADFAVLRLDREVPSAIAQPLQLGGGADVKKGTLIGVFGHPTGLPLKYFFGAGTTISEWNPADAKPGAGACATANEFCANLDTYGGNSGSAVVRSDNPLVVEGILVRGANDYLLDSTNRCFRSVILPAGSGTEVVTKIGVVASHIP